VRTVLAPATPLAVLARAARGLRAAPRRSAAGLRPGVCRPLRAAAMPRARSGRRNDRLF